MNRTRAPLVLAIALAVTAASLWAYWQADRPDKLLSGAAQVLDGDSLVLVNRRVRLAFIDAPELSQTCTRNGVAWQCGHAARMKLIELIAGRPVECRKIETDKYWRTIANCFAGSTNLNKEMVRSGFAIAYRRYSVKYATEELEAINAKHGIWSGRFENPEAWRIKNTQR